MRRTGAATITVIAAALAIAAWLPFLRTVLMADEAGYLLLGQQWHPGDSLYGDFWIDRPPLIVWLYSLIAPFAAVENVPDGTIAPAVKLLGAAVSAVTLVLASLLAREVAPEARWARIAVPILALALLSSPLVGFPNSNGELLALPFAFAGLICMVRALKNPDTRAAGLNAAAAGALAVCAAMVKQNVIDVFVFAAVALIGMWSARRVAIRLALAFAAGSVIALAAIVAVAAMRGSSPGELFHAVVTFRFQASALISDSLSDRRIARMLTLGAAFVVSGLAPILAVGIPMAFRRMKDSGRRHTFALATVAMVAWEIVPVIIGGSYWLHYLTGLIPGVVMLTILVGTLSTSRRWLTVCVALVVMANAAVWAYRIVDPPQARTEAAVASYLAARAGPDDRVLVAFGHPNLVLGSGMQTSYPYLWSLTSRVNDPELQHATRVLTGPDAARWVVVSVKGPTWWDEEGDDARRHVERHFVRHTSIGQWQIWERAPQSRTAGGALRGS